jgi:hypothetical protein
MKTEVGDDEFIELDANSMARGIGRKAIDEELMDYREKGKDAESVDIEVAFSKYKFPM